MCQTSDSRSNLAHQLRVHAGWVSFLDSPPIHSHMNAVGRRSPCFNSSNHFLVYLLNSLGGRSVQRLRTCASCLVNRGKRRTLPRRQGRGGERGCLVGGFQVPLQLTKSTCHCFLVFYATVRSVLPFDLWSFSIFSFHLFFSFLIFSLFLLLVLS